MQVAVKAIASLIESEKKKVWDAAREQRITYSDFPKQTPVMENKYTDYQDYINKIMKTAYKLVKTEFKDIRNWFVGSLDWNKSEERRAAAFLKKVENIQEVKDMIKIFEDVFAKDIGGYKKYVWGLDLMVLERFVKQVEQ